MSLPGRMLAIIYAPAEAYASLKHGVKWYTFVAPWLLAAVLFAVFGFVVDKKIGYDVAYENQMRTMPKIQAMIERQAPADRALAVQNGIRSARRQGYTSGFPMVVIMVIIAAVLLGTFNFGAGAQFNFKTSLAVVAYSYVPFALKMVLASILVWFGAVSPDGFLAQNPIATNFAFLIDPGAHPALSMLLMHFDLFAIWMLVVAAIGYSVLSRLKRSTTLTVIFGWYVIWALIWTGVAALFF